MKEKSSCVEVAIGTKDTVNFGEYGMKRIFLVLRAIVEIGFELGRGRNREFFEKSCIIYRVRTHMGLWNGSLTCIYRRHFVGRVGEIAFDDHMEMFEVIRGPCLRWLQQ